MPSGLLELSSHAKHNIFSKTTDRLKGKVNGYLLAVASQVDKLIRIKDTNTDMWDTTHKQIKISLSEQNYNKHSSSCQATRQHIGLYT